MRVRAGVATIDITPPAGLAMAGFAARTTPAAGAHDPLTVRALAIEDTAVLIADVIGLDREMSARIKARAPLAADRIVVAALHTHGGPISMPSRLGHGADPAYLLRLEDACVQALETACETRRPASLRFGLGADPGVARNRRHADGAVDRAVPVLEVVDAEGTAFATVISYACHPVVLDATNTLWTADYPHFVRTSIEKARPGSTCLFFTGCTGDVNTGHTAQASVSLKANPDRSYPAAERIGEAIARAALAAPCEPVAGEGVDARATRLPLDLARRETEPPEALARQWQAAMETADAAHRPVFATWIAWAGTTARHPLTPLEETVTVLRWGDVAFTGLPGEIFAQTALDIRAAAAPNAFIVSYADDNPGYIPPAAEYAFGGYEVDEAHRYYGLPAGFAQGSAERLRDAAIAAIKAMGLRRR